MSDNITENAEQLRAELSACLSAARGATDAEGPSEWVTYAEVVDLARAHKALQGAVTADPATLLRVQVAKMAPRCVNFADLPFLAGAVDVLQRMPKPLSPPPPAQQPDLAVEQLWRERAEKLAGVIAQMLDAQSDDWRAGVAPAFDVFNIIDGSLVWR
jgi:hypothetical protein